METSRKAQSFDCFGTQYYGSSRSQVELVKPRKFHKGHKVAVENLEGPGCCFRGIFFILRRHKKNKHNKQQILTFPDDMVLMIIVKQASECNKIW